ncbi:MAG TPA: hypothetical protein PKE04_00295 [Clostridia bacterium]|nr:hypothetical protein [Clostridia bacterium]
MQDRASRRAASRAYKAQEDIGGIFRIAHQPSGWQTPLLWTPNLEGERNKLQFAKRVDAPVRMELQAIWGKVDRSGFELIELEQLKRKPDQTAEEFREDLKALLDLWKEREA